MNIPVLIEQLNQTDEHHRIEAKTASEVGKPLIETVCAFSNEPGMDGGYIVLGVQRDDASLFPAYTVVGVDDPDQLSADVATQCADMLNRPIRPQMQTEMVNDKPVVGIYVPEAEPADKPIFFESQGLPGGAFRRISSTDQRCTEDDLLVFYQDRSTESFDRTILPDADLDDIDLDALEDYRRARAEVSPEAEELNWPDEELLRALNAARRKEGISRPTVAGVLLFGEKWALRRLFPAVRVDYLRIPGREWMEDPDRRYVNSVELRGPLMSVIRRALAAVLDDLPKGFHLPKGSLQREESLPLPRRALREAIVNAVMHRNYRVHRPTQIIRYANRIEIVNAGYSLKAEEQLGDVGSEQRNPALASVLHETNFAETKGSGIRIMRRLMKEAGLAPPTFESSRGDNSFTVRLLLHHFLGSDDLEWLDHFGGLSTDQMKALVFVREVGAVDNATYRQLNGVETLKASSALRGLRDAGLLDKKGSGSATYYVPTEKLMEPFRTVSTRSTPSKKSDSNGDSRSKEEALPEEENSLDKGLSEEENSLDKELSEALREDIQQLGRRSSPEQLRAVIIRLCAWRALRAEEIARLLDRNLNYLVHEYLSPMVKEGSLEYTISEMRNHPDQAYRATDV